MRSVRVLLGAIVVALCGVIAALAIDKEVEIALGAVALAMMFAGFFVPDIPKKDGSSPKKEDDSGGDC